jgi:hypothetical protein
MPLVLPYNQGVSNIDIKRSNNLAQISAKSNCARSSSSYVKKLQTVSIKGNQDHTLQGSSRQSPLYHAPSKPRRPQLGKLGKAERWRADDFALE